MTFAQAIVQAQRPRYMHAMSQVFVEERTDGILLIDVSNAFNQMNRSVIFLAFVGMVLL